MLRQELGIQYTSNQPKELAALMQNKGLSHDLEKFSRQVLPELVRIIKANWIGLYIANLRLKEPVYFSYGLLDAFTAYMERACFIEYSGFLTNCDMQYSLPAPSISHSTDNVQYFPILFNGTLNGLLQVHNDFYITDAEQWDNFLCWLSRKIEYLVVNN